VRLVLSSVVVFVTHFVGQSVFSVSTLKKYGGYYPIWESCSKQVRTGIDNQKIPFAEECLIKVPGRKAGKKLEFGFRTGQSWNKY